jgi:hypothetical protein
MLFISLTIASSQHQTTLPPPTQDQIRTCSNPIPSRSHSPLFFLPYLFLSPLPPRSRTSSTNKAATTLHSYTPLLHLNLGSLFHTNRFLPISLCAQSEDVYPCSLYTDIRATATVRTTRVYICPPARRGGQRFNKKFVSFSPFLLCVLDIHLRGTTVHIRLCRRLTLRLRPSPPLLPLPSCFPLCS